MGGATNIIAQRFKMLLDKFMHYSRGQINFHKSCIYGWNATMNTIHNIAQIFGVYYKWIWTHFNYLGMPVSSGQLKAEVWSITIDKMKKKVQQWGSSWLNLVGCMILVKFVLSALPLYLFSLLQAPINIQHKMEATLSQFLWKGGKSEKKKFNLVKWRQVTQNYENGGLAIRIPKLFNIAIGGKIVWRLIPG